MYGVQLTVHTMQFNIYLNWNWIELLLSDQKFWKWRFLYFKKIYEFTSTLPVKGVFRGWEVMGAKLPPLEEWNQGFLDPNGCWAPPWEENNVSPPLEKFLNKPLLPVHLKYICLGVSSPVHRRPYQLYSRWCA